MGNTEISCLNQRGVDRADFQAFKREDTAVADVYKKKVTSPEILKALTSQKSQAPQQARTYDKGSVRVSKF